MKDTVLMQELSWPEIQAAHDAGKTTAILACGAVEQHGPHLPTGTDDYLGTAMAERAARLAGDALVAPTLRPGLSEHHMHFPGSFTLRPSTFVALLEDYCHSLARQGFRRIVVFASHGGNTDSIDLLLTDVVMPGMSGPALAQRLIGQHPSLRVLYMSGYAEEAIERQGSLPAGGELLDKPFTADQLARRVREAIAGSAS